MSDTGHRYSSLSVLNVAINDASCTPTSFHNQSELRTFHAQLSDHPAYKANFTPEEATKAQRGRRGTVILFFKLGDTRWRVVNATPQPIYPW
jgi:hypothetical protein